MPLPVGSTPAFITHVTGSPFIICHALRSSPDPSSTVASAGGGAGVVLAGPGATMGGTGRLMSWTRHFPSGCIGVSSYPTTGFCCACRFTAHADAIAICERERTNDFMMPPYWDQARADVCY